MRAKCCPLMIRGFSKVAITFKVVMCIRISEEIHTTHNLKADSSMNVAVGSGRAVCATGWCQFITVQQRPLRTEQGCEQVSEC